MDKYRTLLDLLQSQVRRNPGSVAISFFDKTLTYAELFQRADQLAQHMLIFGIEPEQQIGIYLERSINIVVAVLAILKLGAAYVPIDPNYPLNRIQQMLNIGNISILITQGSLVPFLPSSIPHVICLDRDWSDIFNNVNKNTMSKTSLQVDLLAYVLYTSGSTGAPKGVMINRSSLVNAYLDWQKAYELSAKDIHLQMASFSFDVFSGDVIRALCSGAKLVLCPRDILLNPSALYALMKQEKITCAEFVPTVLRKLTEYLVSTQQDLSFMRLLICGSDNWSIGEYKKLKSLCGSKTRLINSYGLTEATIDSTYFEMTAANKNSYSDEDSVPIGNPFSNTTIYLLDETLNPVADGATGEIYIAGLGLARGYLNQSELTQKKFINCILDGQSLRLFKTGDLAYRLKDGNIQLIGRSDHQVKLHGHRIELMEIENHLNQYPAITESLVTVQMDKNNHKRLVAYVIFKPGLTIDAKILHHFLKEHLPVYMLPSTFIPLDTLPLLPNGKLDRQFYKDIPYTTANYSDIDSFESEILEKIIRSLKNHLYTNIIDTNDTFSDLGMDSLSIANFTCTLSKQFRIKMNSCELSNHQTIKALAKFIEEQG